MIPRFRGRQPNGEWIYGSCVWFDEDTCYIVPRREGASSLSYTQIFEQTARYVDKDTVEQLTPELLEVAE